MSLAHDKRLHLAAGAVAGTVGTLVAINYGLALAPLVGLGLAVAAGIGKEVLDKFVPGHTVDLLDAVYTVAGGALSCAVVWSLT